MPNTTTAIAPFPDNNNIPNIDKLLSGLNMSTVNLDAAVTRARSHLSNYCLHYGAVKNIPHEDTGVVIGLIVYFIAHEPTINLTKLEAYILLLNVICSRLYGRAFLECRLTTGGRIGHFRTFINYMKEKELIKIGDNHAYCLCTNAAWLIKNTPNIFMSITPILIAILQNWGHKNGKQTLGDALYLMGYSIAHNRKLCQIARMWTDDIQRRTQEQKDIIDVEVSEDNDDKAENSTKQDKEDKGDADYEYIQVME